MGGGEGDRGASVRHDTAVALARAILEIVAPCLRPEEQRDAYKEFYRVVRAGLDAYEEVNARDRQLCPKPSLN